MTLAEQIADEIAKSRCIDYDKAKEWIHTILKDRFLREKKSSVIIAHPDFPIDIVEKALRDEGFRAEYTSRPILGSSSYWEISIPPQGE